MAHIELEPLGLLVAVAGLALRAGVLRIPYPIFLVLGGLILGFVPGVPEIELNPDLVLLIFLPPLLYAAAFLSSLRDLRAHVWPISLLAIGLVSASALTVAATTHWVVGLSWPVAFVLGTIVSPTDVVAPASSWQARAGCARIPPRGCAASTINAGGASPRVSGTSTAARRTTRAARKPSSASSTRCCAPNARSSCG